MHTRKQLNNNTDVSCVNTAAKIAQFCKPAMQNTVKNQSSSPCGSCGVEYISDICGLHVTLVLLLSVIIFGWSDSTQSD